jgi:hypothetical protein
MDNVQIAIQSAQTIIAKIGAMEAQYKETKSNIPASHTQRREYWEMHLQHTTDIFNAYTEAVELLNVAYNAQTEAEQIAENNVIIEREKCGVLLSKRCEGEEETHEAGCFCELCIEAEDENPQEAMREVIEMGYRQAIKIRNDIIFFKWNIYSMLCETKHNMQSACFWLNNAKKIIAEKFEQ